MQALDRFEPRFTIRVRGGKLPTRLTYAQPAEPVTLVIPAPDPDLAIRLYAQDTTFEPPVLTFSSSNEASFTMWTKSLAEAGCVRSCRSKREILRRDGDRCGVGRLGAAEEFECDGGESVYEAQFHALERRRRGWEEVYAEFRDGERVERWTRAIRAQVEEGVKQKAVRGMMGRATEMASLQVLRETLIAPEERGWG